MREFEEYFIEAQFNGLTVKEYVRSVLKISARNFQKLTRARGLLINGKVTNVERKVRAGDSLKVIVLREKNNLLAQEQVLNWQVQQNQSWATNSASNVATAQATANQMQWITNTPSLVDIAG